MDAETLDSVFAALAHPDRRRIIDLLVESPGATTADLASNFETSRIAVMKNIRLLESAELVISRKEGRYRRHFFNAIPLQRICDRWTDAYADFWAPRMVDIKERIESRLADESTPHEERKRA